MLLGRQSEREVLDRLLAGARRGEGGGVVVLGEPGIGKTALIEQAVTSAQDFRVLMTAGQEAEMELAFAALQQLCAPGLDRLERLPELQRDALGVVFGLRTGDPPDRLLVALAVLTLLSEMAAERPLLCVVDDAQWLDRASAQAVAFVARRLATEAVAFLFGARELPDEFRGLPEMVVEGLGDGDARTLFGSVFPYRLDGPVVDRIVAETHGNPLALLELPRGLSPAQVAGGFGLPVSVPLAGRIEESFRRRLAGLPSPSRRLLLVAAADPTGDAVLVWRAAGLLGIADSAAEAAEAGGLVDFTAGVVFRHPLVRSAVYGAASARERRQAHQALAEATDPAVDPDRRAWHRAQATSRPDEDVSADLELSAGRAQARGGFAAAAAFMERSTELTVDPARRAGRALVAAEANRQAGALAAAVRLAALAERGLLDDAQRAQLDLLRAQISFASDRGSDAPPPPPAQSRPAPRAPRPETGARDLPRCPDRRDVRGPAGERGQCARSGQGGHPTCAVCRTSPRLGPSARWSGASDHRRVRRQHPGLAPGGERLSERGRRHRGALALVVAGRREPHRSSGITTAGTCSRPARFKSPAMLVPSPCSPSP